MKGGKVDVDGLTAFMIKFRKDIHDKIQFSMMTDVSLNSNYN